MLTVQEVKYYYTDKESLLTYANKVRVKGYPCALVTCPHCDNLSVYFYDHHMLRDYWVDAVNKEKTPVAWCAAPSAPSGASTQHPPKGAASRHTYLLDGLVKHSDIKATPDTNKCTCDYETVVRTVGCQCGGN